MLATRSGRGAANGGWHTARAAPRTPRTLLKAFPGDLLPLAPVADPAAVERATYIALGATAASFVGTFFVAPRFKSSFKEELDWKTIYAQLVAGGGVRSVTPEAAAKGRSVLLDVRVPSKYEAGHPPGALPAPLYLPIAKWDLASNLRRAAFAFFGIAGTELNARFADDVAALVPRGREVVVICEMGGDLTNRSGTQFGFQSRSLKAAFFLQRAGYKVSYVKGGIAQWAADGLPLEQGSAEEALDAVGGSRRGATSPAADAQPGPLQLLGAFGGAKRR